MKIYLSSPFFNEEEISNMRKTQEILQKRGFDLVVPMDIIIPNTNEVEWAEKMFEADKQGIDDSDIVVLLYYGLYSDSGTAWECGYAFAKNKPVVVVHCQKEEKNNLMVVFGASANLANIEDLIAFDFENINKTNFYGHTSLS
ncbi:MAG: nucleoside 2-deoxyribosyltransferase [Clostridia bacterium]|nr:nucleoside 2-deoxyribosyltransferase [Clostridia bacterium]